jgi:hypothetical protein
MQVTAILSMLHEPPGALHAALRRFRNEPVLRWTLRRLQQSKNISRCAILCWEDQADAVAPIAAEREALLLRRNPRVNLSAIESVAASRRWADGWRGGLLGACEFDRGFYAPWAAEAMEQTAAEAIALVDPAAGLVDAHWIDAAIDHLFDHPEQEFCFTQAAPGLAGVVMRQPLVQRLATAKTHAGWALAYRPELPRPDPIATDACLAVPAAMARTTRRFTLDSDRQIRRLSREMDSLNGQLISSDAEHLVRQPSADEQEFPRDVTLELTPRRASKPIFWPGAYQPIERAELTLANAATLFEQLAAADDLRLTLGGHGDPLLHPQAFEIIALAREAGIAAISVETDLLGISSEIVDRLAESNVDVVSIHLPAVTQRTYAAVMGVDGYPEAFSNLKKFVARWSALGRGTPLLCPTFVKCRVNLAEMEAWYDQWIIAVGAAVIVGPGACGGIVPDISVAQMAPPRRAACVRLSSRMTALSDGRITSCEEDATGAQALGTIGQADIATIWRERFALLRADHAACQWGKHPVCSNCTQWHRP